MKHLLNPDEQVMSAVVRLNDTPDFQVLKAYLFDLVKPTIIEKWKLRKDPIENCWSQGAMQLLDDIQEVTIKALGWIEQIYASKKGGHGNV